MFPSMSIPHTSIMRGMARADQGAKVVRVERPKTSELKARRFFVKESRVKNDNFIFAIFIGRKSRLRNRLTAGLISTDNVSKTDKKAV